MMAGECSLVEAGRMQEQPSPTACLVKASPSQAKASGAPMPLTLQGRAQTGQSRPPARKRGLGDQASPCFAFPR